MTARVLVTGGCGFIGRHLVRRLVAEGREVRVLDDLSSGDPAALPDGVELIRGSVTDRSAVAAAVAGSDVVYHLAAIASVEASNRSWSASDATNAGGSVTVMEAIRDVAPRAAFVFASSAAVYGDPESPPGARIPESTPLRPLSPYGIDKYATEMHARVGGSLFGLASCSLRLFNVFGPEQSPDSPYSGVITRFIDRARRGEPLRVNGDGLQTRDFVHVDDVVSALLLAAPAATDEAPVINVCTGAATTVRALAETVATLVEPSPEIVSGPERAGDIRHSLGDPALARRLLGWEPRVCLADGLAGLLAPRARAS